MKKTLASASFLVAATSAMIVSAAPPDLQGSDTLEEFAGDLISSNCRGATNLKIGTAAGGFLNYVGGGSGTAGAAMASSFAAPTTTSQVAGPMSRALNASECTAAGNPATAQGVVVGLDGIVIVGDQTTSSSCSVGAGAAGIPNLPNATAAWKATLMLLYTGHGASGNDATDLARICNSADRQQLAAKYSSLFQSGCSDATVDSTTCSGGIKHAYRRGDISGTTDTFLSLIGAPAVVRTPAGTGPVTGVAFCNGFEADDKDPIRRNCSQDEQVCEYDGTLGLVLPIVVPTLTNELAGLFNASNTSNAAASPLYFNRDPAANGDVEASGDFVLVKAPLCASAPPSNIDPTGLLPVANATTVGYNITGTFPNDLRCDCRFPVPESYTSLGFPANPHFNWNKRYGGKCFGTVHRNPDSTLRYGVLNGDNGTQDNTPSSWGNRIPSGGKIRCCRKGTTTPIVLQTEDPRLLNLVLRNPTDTTGPGNGLGGNGAGANWQPPAYYRIHSNKAGLSAVGIAGSTQQCEDPDATRLIGCLVQNPSTCSVGYAGREAADSSVPGAIVGTAFGVGGAPPTVAAIQALIDPGLATVAYPLSRRLYYNTMIGFGNGVLANNPAGASNYAEAQYDLYKCMADQQNSRAASAQLPGGGFATKQSLAKAGFVEVPALPGIPAGPKLCNNMCPPTASTCQSSSLVAIPAASLTPSPTP